MALTVLTMSACYDKKTNEKTKEVITESQFKANTNNSKPLPNPPEYRSNSLYITFTFEASKGATFWYGNGSK